MGHCLTEALPYGPACERKTPRQRTGRGRLSQVHMICVCSVVKCTCLVPCVCQVHMSSVCMSSAHVYVQLM
jgi:hypothetical protein